MSQFVGQIERHTQNRIVRLFCEELGYRYLGNWEDRQGNSNIEEDLLTQYLFQKGYSQNLISKAIYELRNTANNYQLSLYNNNNNVYELLRYGVGVVPEAGVNTETVHFIDWKNPQANDFAIAEEVTILGNREKRPDIVIYVNGIALGVLELKRSTVSISDGIRQNITNQQKEFIESFFTTIQWVFAGNDTQGLRYGAINTPEKYYLHWKEDTEQQDKLLLDKYLLKLCEKQRFLEIIYDFMLFDGGIKKICRHNQYFGVKSAQEFIRRKENGIIWHTQGSGKSLSMVWLAKWILENNPHARVAIITDRDELDKQIERVFLEAGENQIKRTRSGRELMSILGSPLPRLVCSLVHKFGKKEVGDFDAFIDELQSNPLPVVGELFIFVDECHRTQSGRLHKTMKAMLPNAVFIGFTGTPLLKKDKQTSIEVFGRYIHTYKFNEAVEDNVVLDLVYEARDIDQKISSQQRVDDWFEAKTRGLNDFQKSEIKKRWGTMQKVLSSKSRLDKIVADIVMDFNTKPRLNSGMGNAILVAPSIYDACRYYELFQQTEFRGKCAVITSYNPSTKDIALEDTGANTETEKEYIFHTYEKILGKKATGAYEKSTEQYEDEAKAKFIKQPANMRLLIAVNKLLVGFDAPPCTYLYIDKNMQDHGLFQAICRVNRLDGEDKQFGYIVDYKNLFDKVENAVAVYTSELDYDEFEKEDVDILLKDRLSAGKERLDKALEDLHYLCEPVLPPKDTLAYIHYFCGNPEDPESLKATEVQRTTLYKMIVQLIRAYANITADMEEAGYLPADISDIKRRVDFYLNLREEIKNASGEVLDLKAYEADMRHLIDTYIQAEDSRVISPFGEDQTLLDLIVNSGLASAINSLPKGIRSNRDAIAETIENNIRQKIIKEHLIDPAYFEKMSKLLDEVIKQRKDKAVDYEQHLQNLANIARNVKDGGMQNLPGSIKTPALKALYHNLGDDEQLASQVNEAVIRIKKAGFRGNQAKENEIKQEIFKIIPDIEEVERIFKVIEKQQEY
ncbi:MAG: HsdR family type I site-specific deoxyribonuclease [Saprospiraceae bacterium]|nr:HsdR family type I site-specific deoxyribonuclease [Saprospiraceae bacterium]